MEEGTIKIKSMWIEKTRITALFRIENQPMDEALYEIRKAFHGYDVRFIRTNEDRKFVCMLAQAPVIAA